MTFSKIGRILTALVASASIGLGMTACGGGTIGYMWVLGTYYNQITGYKIDDYTGNLTAVLKSPFTSGGSNPQMLAVKPGGRFLYVVNQGTGQVGAPGQPNYKPATGYSISEFAVGGSGELTYQNNYFSQGSSPRYITFDSTGNYLYVLDEYAPDYATTGNGSITAFSVASDTGELTLVPNNAVLNPNGTPTYFFEVGANPVMSKIGSGNCLYTLSPTEIVPYVVSGTSGTLTPATTGPLVFGTFGAIASGTGVNLTSINTSNSGQYTYLTDGAQNRIFALQTGGTACTLTQVGAGSAPNFAANVVPVNSLTESRGKYLYVINQAIPSTVSTSASSISAFVINNAGQLSQLTTDGINNPYATGAGPVCIVEDPSSKYIYISNSIDSTVTGKLLNQNNGDLADLQHGSTFPATKSPTCLAVSGNI